MDDKFDSAERPDEATGARSARDLDPDETDWRSEMEDEGKERPDAPPPVDGPMVHVSVDWVELEGALENNSPELHSFLNKITGDVIRVFQGSDNADTRMKEIEASADFVYIEPISSREQYRWMEEFIEIVEDAGLKEKLNIAIDGKGAFRRFKDVLVGYPVERERWFVKRSTKLRAHMTEWLAAKRIGPTNTPPWESGGQEAEGEKPGREDESPRPRYDGADLRAAAHELVDLVPSRELSTVVTFLEFLRSRRGFRRQR
ncbi:MAG: UPF0158 family protein [Deltaproteobacteria bacterium]|nr:UPF0158 family protein [Deltaproteobacteria bacterium]